MPRRANYGHIYVIGHWQAIILSSCGFFFFIFFFANRVYS